jgi:hypothetical protein
MCPLSNEALPGAPAVASDSSSDPAPRSALSRRDGASGWRASQSLSLGRAGEGAHPESATRSSQRLDGAAPIGTVARRRQLVNKQPGHPFDRYAPGGEVDPVEVVYRRLVR